MRKEKLVKTHRLFVLINNQWQEWHGDLELGSVKNPKNTHVKKVCFVPINFTEEQVFRTLLWK